MMLLIAQAKNKINDAKSVYLNSPDIDYSIDSSEFDDVENSITELEEMFESED